MSDSSSQWLVETDWLAAHLDAPDLVVLDASLHLPTTGRNPKAEYLQAHIPGALFFDIEDVSDEKNPLPHMLPSPAKFASRMKKMGVGDGMRVVVYDTEGLYSAARGWWMFRVMGHNDVAVLNGGLKKWKAEGRPLEDGAPSAPHGAAFHGPFPRRAGARRRRDEGSHRGQHHGRWSMPAPPVGSRVAMPIRVRACGPDTSRRRATCLLRRCSIPTAR